MNKTLHFQAELFKNNEIPRQSEIESNKENLLYVYD